MPMMSWGIRPIERGGLYLGGKWLSLAGGLPVKGKRGGNKKTTENKWEKKMKLTTGEGKFVLEKP